MAQDDRPLSPHLQVYRPQLHTVMSISHRATGVLLALTSLLLVCWLLAAASGPEVYARAQQLFGHWLIQALLVVVSFSFYYHLCNGIRHLAWDAGWGFEMSQTRASGWATLLASVLLTAGFWLLVVGGGR